MTQEPKDIVVVTVPETFEQRAARLLSSDDLVIMTRYIESGGKRLASDTATSFFQIYLNGGDTKEIHRLNKAFPYESILIERIRGDWDLHREQYVEQLKVAIRDRLIKANLETVGLMTDMVAVAYKKHGDKLKKYLQTGNEKDLDGAMNVDSIHQLIKVLEGLHKAVGIEKPKDGAVVNNFNVHTQNFQAVIQPAEAAKNLAVAADAKRKGA